MNRINSYLLAVISGILFAISWPTHGFALFLFVAFVPLLLMIEQHQKSSLFEVFRSCFVAFLIWNIAATWWICKYHFLGGSVVILLNSLSMASVMTLFALLKQKNVVGSGSFLAFISLWLSWEWVHQYWDLSWPWLNLGNGFATWPQMIQWYEFTGVFGGTLWVLVINMLLFRLLTLTLEKQFRRPFVVLSFITVAIIVIPTVYSWQRFNQKTPAESFVNVLVIQQNTNPNTEQNSAHAELVEQRITSLIDAKMDSTIDLVVIPESALITPVCENEVDSNLSLQRLQQIQRRYHKSSILVGANSYRWLGKDKKQVEKFNTAFFMDSSSVLGIYHKSKLVPGVERYPLAWITAPIYRWLDAEDFDPKFTPDTNLKNFTLLKNNTSFTAAICYESVYGDYLAQHLRKGSGFIALITNDGWWGNSDGYRQHLAYTQLRAIETRRAIVRAANTGISAVISPNGILTEQTEWNRSCTIVAKVPVNNFQTFYVKNGDYILRIANFVSLTLLILLLINLFLRKKQKKSRS